MTHFYAGHADRDAVLSYGKVVLVFHLYTPFLVEVDEKRDPVALEILIERHSIMGGI